MGGLNYDRQPRSVGVRGLPGGLPREMQADDDRALVLRSTLCLRTGQAASKALTRGKNRVRVELAHIKGLVAALAEAAADPVALPTTGGGIMGKLQLSVKSYVLRCRSIQGMTRPARPV
jgi:hypothetical protein